MKKTIYGYKADGEALTTQVDTMEYWFKNNVGVTLSQRECSKMFGFDRLASIVCILKKRGMNIKSEEKPVTTRYGGVSYPSFYSYENFSNVSEV